MFKNYKSQMPSVVLLLSLLLLPLSARCQYENVWVGGWHQGIDFNTNPPTNFQSAINVTESSAVICNRNGRLLFYTDGSRVWDSTHTMMPNGNYLAPYAMGGGSVGNDALTSATSSTANGAVIVPIPGDDYRYYVFSLTMLELGPQSGELFYSIVDMRLNDGKGDVPMATKSVLLSRNLTEQMISVSGDNCDVWLLTVSWKDSVLKAFRITAQGVDRNPVTSPLSEIMFKMRRSTSHNHLMMGIDVSADRTLLAVSGDNIVGLYNFDPATGQASGERLITVDANNPDDYVRVYDVGLSTGKTKLYLSEEGGAWKLYQFDLGFPDVADIARSRKTVQSGRRHGGIRLREDGRMYLGIGGADFISIIEHPDSLYPACNYGALLPYPQLRQVYSFTTIPTRVSFAHLRPDTNIQSLAIPVCFEDSVVLTIPSATETSGIYWSTGTADSVIVVRESGAYWVEYVRDCRLHIDTFHVSFFNPELEIAHSCAGHATGSAWLNFSLTPLSSYSLSWRNAAGNDLSASDTLQDAPAGKYALHITGAAVCDTVIHFQIDALPDRVSFDLSDTVICAGDTVRLQNTSSSYYDTLLWYVNGRFFNDHVTWEYTFAEPGNYEVRLAGSGLVCRDTFTRRVTVDAPVDSLGFVSDRDEICAGDPVRFVPHGGDKALSLSWDFGDGAEDENNGSETVIHRYEAPGTYPVTVAASFRACPPVSYMDSIKVHDVPDVYLGEDTFYCRYSTPVVLYNNHPDPDRATYIWNTGSGASSIEVSTSGTYILTVKNEAGCSGSDTIEVGKDCYTAIPNVFTPDNDGYNDYFFPVQLLSRGAASFHMQVFNRWGQKIYESRDLNGQGWDGTLNGRPQTPGVYIYQISVVYQNGNQEQYQGNVTLLR